jgi:hypothetical protein
MRFCIRREINFANSEERLGRVEGVPIEIALPPNLEDFLENRHRLLDVKRQIKKFKVPVRSVHAPHGHLADATFRNWAGGVIGFAEAVGSEIVVFHPETSSKEMRRKGQEAAILNLKYVQDRTQAIVAVETFREEDRVLTPDEIMENHLPMVLDTSLVPKPEITWIMESYRTHVVNLHLSAVIHNERHAATGRFRPVDSDPFCLDILDRLQELEWKGVVTLEYMPWLSAKSMEDRHLLERIYHQNTEV